MVCIFCKSEFLYLKETEGKTGLYCKSCGRWIRWVDSVEKMSIERELDRQRREIRLEGADVARAIEKYKAYRQKYKVLSDEISSTKDIVAKSGSEIGKSALYSKVLKLKELGIRIDVYKEVFRTLGLKSEPA